MLKIKLFPKGKKHQRTFRVIVAEDRSKFNGKFIADLGFYTPQTKTVEIDKEALNKWVKNGAQVTLGVDKLLNPDKHPRIKRQAAQAQTEAAPAAETAAPETPAPEA